MIIRLSQKLGIRIKVGVLRALPPDENPFADWSAQLFMVGRTSYIIVCNTRSLYSIVTYAKGMTRDDRFIPHMLDSIREYMEDDGLRCAFERQIAPVTHTVIFAKALNRSVTGSMNELIAYAKLILADGEMSPYDVNQELNSFLLSSLAELGHHGYGEPGEAFKRLLASTSHP